MNSKQLQDLQNEYFNDERIRSVAERASEVCLNLIMETEDINEYDIEVLGSLIKEVFIDEFELKFIKSYLDKAEEINSQRI